MSTLFDELKKAAKNDPVFSASLTRLAKSKAAYEEALDGVIHKATELRLDEWAPPHADLASAIEQRILTSSDFKEAFGAGREKA